MTWVARNLLIAVVCAIAGYVVVALAGAAGLRAEGEEAIDVGEYVFTLALSALWVWPLYMGGSARVGLLARDGVARFDNFALYLAT